MEYIGRLIATCLCVLALGAACGDAEAPSTAEAQERGVSKDEYIERGDALCGQLEADFASVAIEDEEDPSQAADYFTRLIELSDPLIDRFQALEPPAGGHEIAGRLNRYLDQIQAGRMAVVAAAEERNRDAAIEADSQVKTSEGAFQREAGRYGFDDCARYSL